MKSHFQELASLYGKQTLVNLVNHKGHEKPVKEAYERYSSEVYWHPMFLWTIAAYYP
jgi:phosphatidylinositol 4-phosphatase